MLTPVVGLGATSVGLYWATETGLSVISPDEMARNGESWRKVSGCAATFSRRESRLFNL